MTLDRGPSQERILFHISCHREGCEAQRGSQQRRSGVEIRAGVWALAAHVPSAQVSLPRVRWGWGTLLNRCSHCSPPPALTHTHSHTHSRWLLLSKQLLKSQPPSKSRESLEVDTRVLCCHCTGLIFSEPPCLLPLSHSGKPCGWSRWVSRSQGGRWARGRGRATAAQPGNVDLDLANLVGAVEALRVGIKGV